MVRTGKFVGVLRGQVPWLMLALNGVASRTLDPDYICYLELRNCSQNSADIQTLLQYTMIRYAVVSSTHS
jgi:hypothetical protein